LTLVFCVSAIAAGVPAAHRQQIAAGFGWKFGFGDPAGAQESKFNDKSWRTINVPHDWSIKGTPDEKNLTGSGGGYFPAGIGWYRKSFDAPKT
jgi:beta-galactosidase